jgi:hypothetical protein
MGVLLGFKEKCFFCFVLVSSITSMEICQYVLMREVLGGGGGWIVSFFVFKPTTTSLNIPIAIKGQLTCGRVLPFFT